MIFNRKEQLPIRSGFSLIELLVSMMIFSGLLIVITRFGMDIAGYSVFFGESLEVQEEITKTLKVMSVEIRAIGPADTGAYPIASAAGNTVTFFSDYNGDGKFEQIRYFMNGTSLMRGVTNSSGNPLVYNPANETTTEVIHNVTSNPSTLFTYYGEGYTGTGAALSEPINIPLIRLMTITVTANQNTKGGPGQATETTSVTIRNFRTQQ